MNDQIEWLNQIVEQYLRYYVNYQQDNWVVLLSMTQFTYNNSTQASTGISSFQTEYERDMIINDETIKSRDNNEQAIQ